MSILSVLNFSASGALHRGHIKSFVDEQPAASPRLPANKRFELISVVVASKDALQARKALQGCPDAFILRCLPMHKNTSVKLEIRFPAGQSDVVIGRIQACLPSDEFGGVVACATPCPRPRRAHPNVFRTHGF